MKFRVALRFLPILAIPSYPCSWKPTLVMKSIFHRSTFPLGFDPYTKKTVLTVDERTSRTDVMKSLATQIPMLSLSCLARLCNAIALYT